MVPGEAPIQSALKRETSLVGLAYLNYIYQINISNQHFCEAMLLMHAQVPPGTKNPYVALFPRPSAPARPWRRWPTSSSPSTTPSRARSARSQGRSLACDLAQDRRLKLPPGISCHRPARPGDPVITVARDNWR
jgi:hypothetical protein